MTTHVCPWHLPNVEELVVSPRHNSILDLSVCILDLLRKQSTSKGGKWGRYVIVFEFVHLPALDMDIRIRRGLVVRRLDEFWIFLWELHQVIHELCILLCSWTTYREIMYLRSQYGICADVGHDIVEYSKEMWDSTQLSPVKVKTKVIDTKARGRRNKSREDAQRERFKSYVEWAKRHLRCE